MRILAPGLWSYSINWTITAWLQALEMADVPAYAAGVGLALHIPFNILFIYWLGYGYLGVAMATIAFQAIQPLLILFYLFGTCRGMSRLRHNTGADAIGRTSILSTLEIQAGITSLSGIIEYVSLALPGVVVISEWWASEWAIFESGRLQPSPQIALGAMTLYQSLNTLCFMFPVAFAVAGATRVGNLLGANDSKGAALAAKICVYNAMFASGTIACVLFFAPHWLLPSLFAPGDSVVKETSKTIPLLAFYIFADGIQVGLLGRDHEVLLDETLTLLEPIQCALNGVVKGCGRQCIAMPIVVFAYWVVGVPLAYYLAFVRNSGQVCSEHQFCGDVGLVAG